jgi:cyclopropane fatty-acyl-phospholipid synthase-like methyltransferase
MTGVAASLLYGQTRISPNNLAPYVPSPEAVVIRMLEAAELKPGETLYDLGCGDGRILILAAQRFRANAVGIELSEKLVRHAIAQAEQLGLQKRIKVIQGDLREADLRDADVVTIYLSRLSNEQLKPKLKAQLKAGARVVSHDYPIMGWKPTRVEKIEVLQRPHAIYVYRMPPQE